MLTPYDNNTVETRWCQLRNVIQSTALEVLGRARRQNQDAEISNLLAENTRPPSQCGFRLHRGTSDMMFAACRLQEKCQEMRTHP
ncbi:unnamed protein product [Schistocephalus solidus]|uniref:Uncharacterized protein n=1 Tax=Schistocephalus solidus TaxID=70667 RepID=A0A183TSR2_SCHSO|nr:unnamed protein product [Schistocephalus solidus]